MCIACSTDGKICVIEIMEEDGLGQPVSRESKNTIIKSLYGDDVSSTPILIENVDQLHFETQPSVNEIESISGRTVQSDKMDIVNTLPKPSSAPANPPLPNPVVANKVIIPQKEQVLPNGRKRITPTFLGR